ncbi:AAA family ATPase [bacterium]|nr:AAA family ATPase [bacterium]
MKLDEFYINGFGKFHNYKIENIHPHLTILLGPNEIGKSTLMNFIKRVLFGYPDKRSNLNLYPPLDGGKQGGKVIITRNDGQYIIERYAEDKNNVKVVLPNGSLNTLNNISYLVSTITPEVFNNIYAFGLDELQSFETLNSESIKDQLYSAGKGIGHFSLKEFQRTIDDNIGNLFKTTGNKPEINILFSNLKENSRQIHEIEAESTKYKELQTQLEDIIEKIQKEESEKTELRKKVQHATSLKDAWQDFRTRQELYHQLESIPSIENFPDNGVVLLDSALEKQSKYTQSIRVKTDLLNKTQQKISELIINEDLINNRALILELQKGQDQYVSALKDLPLIQQQNNREIEELNTLLKVVGEGWNSENFEEIDTSISNKEKIRTIQKSIEEISTFIQKKENELTSLKKEQNRYQEELEDKKASFNEIKLDFKDKEELSKKQTLLFQLEENLVNWNDKRAEIKTIEEKEALKNLFDEKSSKPENTKLFIHIFFYAITFLSFFGSLFSIITKVPSMAIFIGLFYILSVSFLFFFKKRENDENMEDNTKEPQETSYLSQRKASIASEIETLKEEIRKQLIVFSFRNVPSKTDLENLKYKFRSEFTQFDRKKDLDDQQKKLERLLESKNSELEKILQEKKELEIRLNEAQLVWRTFLEKNKFGPGLSPTALLETFSIIDTALEKKKAIMISLDRIKAMKDSIVKFKEKMKPLLRTLKYKESQTDLISTLERIIEELAVSMNNLSELKAKKVEEKAIYDDLKNTQQDLEKVNLTIQKLLEAGGAVTLEEFYANGKAFLQRKELNSTIQTCDNNIKRIIGEGIQFENFLEELRDTSYEALISNKDDLEEAIDRIEESLNSLKVNQGKFIQEIEQIEKKEESSALRLEKSVNIEKVNIKALEWAKLVLAKSIMKKAIEAYEREKQPDVIKESQRFFSLMTLNKYPYIFSPLNEKVIYIEDDHHNRKEIHDLSKGTAEQLYLSLRFGFIIEFSKNTEPLPIMMDDILVNFDPKRFDACCEAIRMLSKTHQVLYFTCHPDSAKKMQEVVNDSRLIFLEDRFVS